MSATKGETNVGDFSSFDIFTAGLNNQPLWFFFLFFFYCRKAVEEIKMEWKDYQPLTKKTAWRQSYYTKHGTNILHLHHFRPPPQQDTIQGAAWSCRLCDYHINTRKQSSLPWHHPVAFTIYSLRARNESNVNQKYLKFPQKYIYILTKLPPLGS